MEHNQPPRVFEGNETVRRVVENHGRAPKYTIRLWTNYVIIKLIRVKYTCLLPTYRRYPHNIERADIARLVVVHAEGGIYADLDAYSGSAEHIRYQNQYFPKHQVSSAQVAAFW